MLRRLWEAWKKLAHAIGNFQARLLLTVIFAVLVLPFGLAVRFFADALRTRRRPQSWLDCRKEARDLNWARQQW